MLLIESYDNFYQKSGYRKLKSNICRLKLYLNPVAKNGQADIVAIYDNSQELLLTKENVNMLKNSIKDQLLLQDTDNIQYHVLLVIFGYKPVIHNTGLCDVIFVNQLNGVCKSSKIQKCLREEVSMFQYINSCVTDNSKVYDLRSHNRNTEHIPICSYLFIILNLFIFLAVKTNNEKYYLSLETLEAGQFYRLITYMFMHTGLLHLAGNMLSLIYIGPSIEREIGSLQTLFIYILSGVLGGVASIVTYKNPVAGASGAICGLLTGLLVIQLRKSRYARGNSLSQIVSIIVLTIFTGMILGSKSVSTAAHVGGMVTGFVFTLLLTECDLFEETFNRSIIEKKMCKRKGIKV